MELDLNLLARLLKHRRFDETGYLTGMEASAGDAGADHLQVNQMGDNPMKDPSTALKETFDGTVTPEMIERLKEMLAADGIGEAAIAMQDYSFDGDGLLTIGDTTFPEHDMLEMANQMGCSCGDVGEAGDMILAVLEAMGDNMQESMGFPALSKKLAEFRANDATIDARFTHTVDSLGDVVINDAVTGKSVYLQGSDAMELLGQIPDGASEGQLQHVLSQYQHVMESEQVVNDMDSAIDTVSELKSLDVDLQNMRLKLEAMSSKAQQSGDVAAACAADMFTAEVERFEQSLAEYLSTGGLV
jgi:hypothetical protein